LKLYKIQITDLPDEETSGAKAIIREPLLQRPRSWKKADAEYTKLVSIVQLKEEMEILDRARGMIPRSKFLRVILDKSSLFDKRRTERIRSCPMSWLEGLWKESIS